MDPKFVQQHIADLPNIQLLSKDGEFKHLQTTMPPQSPVAWSTFSTGLDPDKHGIFDFVYRDPKTGVPFSAMGESEEPSHNLEIGRYHFPLGSPHIKTFRKGVVFWKLLADAGVPVKILRMPVNYPPVKTKGDSLSGMGVPDMRGTFGTYTFFNNPPMQNDRAVLAIEGPANPYLKDHAATSVTLIVDVDPFEDVARFRVQDQTFILRSGEWSGWIPVTFIHSAHGMFRVYAKGFRPDFQVYVSPVNFNPSHPDSTISSPASYSAKLADKIGPYYTQGMPEDTAAYRQNVFTRQEYLIQSRMVSDEQIRMLKQGLADYHQGFFFLHFSGIDQNSHMLWGKFDQELLETYKLVDQAIGWVMHNCPGATLIVMSDHGFTSFDRAVNLNVILKPSAYALGLNGIYLNHPDPALKARLLALRDPKSGRQVITKIFAPTPGPYIPNLIVGFAAGYRTAWNGGPLFADNTDAWIGDHCMDPDAVPGVLIANRKSHIPDPRLKDLTSSILALYGVTPASGMDGKVIY